MEILSTLLGVLLDQGVTTAKERIRRDPPAAERLATNLAKLTTLGLTGTETHAVARWLERQDVMTALLTMDRADIEAAAIRLESSLAHELGEPSASSSHRAHDICVAAVSQLILLVAPHEAGLIAIHDTLRGDSADLKAGQAEIYRVVLDLQAHMSPPELSPARRPSESSASSNVSESPRELPTIERRDTLAAADEVSSTLKRAVRKLRSAYQDVEHDRRSYGPSASTLYFHRSVSAFNDSLQMLRDVVDGLDLTLQRLDDGSTSELYGHLCDVVGGLSSAKKDGVVPGFPDEYRDVEGLVGAMSDRVETLRRALDA